MNPEAWPYTSRVGRILVLVEVVSIRLACRGASETMRGERRFLCLNGVLYACTCIGSARLPAVISVV